MNALAKNWSIARIVTKERSKTRSFLKLHFNLALLYCLASFFEICANIKTRRSQFFCERSLFSSHRRIVCCDCGSCIASSRAIEIVKLLFRNQAKIFYFCLGLFDSIDRGKLNRLLVARLITSHPNTIKLLFGDDGLCFVHFRSCLLQCFCFTDALKTTVRVSKPTNLVDLFRRRNVIRIVLCDALIFNSKFSCLR